MSAPNNWQWPATTTVSAEAAVKDNGLYYYNCNVNVNVMDWTFWVIGGGMKF